MSTLANEPPLPAAEAPEDGPLPDAIARALRGLRFGTVTLVVHDGAVVQIDRTEKLRVAPRRTRS